MKGIVFNLLERIVTREFGETTWDDLLDAAQLDGAYTSLGSYPDGDMMKLVAAASTALKMPADGVLRWFGSHALPLLAERYPEFFHKHKSTRSFLLTLNDVIHPEVRKIYPGADVPVFDFNTSSDDTLELKYRSTRRICGFAAGLIEGATGYFGEEVVIEHPQCLNRGDGECVFTMTFREREL